MIDGGAVLLRSDNTFDFEGLRSRHGQAGAILVAYDVMELDGQDMRPEALEERRKRLSKLLSRSNKAMRDGMQVSEAITGDGAAIFRHACGLGLEGIVSKRIGSRWRVRISGSSPLLDGYDEPEISFPQTLESVSQALTPDTRSDAEHSTKGK